ncbi:MAG TPA: hypothetical protein VF447_07265 [Terriglobales bacterium]
MKRVGLFFVLLAVALVPAMAQNIETETSDRTRIVHLKTALNHLTVIEIAEPVVQVAAGSPSFKVEWRENKVFVQPTEADATTNLFIWTANQRLNYELEPAGAVSEMDFAVDQKPVHVEPIKPASAHPVAPPSATELLLTGTPIRLLPSKQHANKPVEVWISDVYEKDGSLLVRYAVRNYGSETYSLESPAVYQLDGVRSQRSLYGLMNSQLGDEQAGRLKAKRQTPVNVLDGQAQPARIAPGEEAVGVVRLQTASSTQPTVLRFEFPSPKQPDSELSDGPQSKINAFLVR